MENSIFEKKKRGRKPKDKPETSDVVTEKVHKKRGRRPKIKTTNEYDENENDDGNDGDENDSDDSDFQ